MKKKSLAFCLAMVMLCSLFLPGCGQEQAYAEEETTKAVQKQNIMQRSAGTPSYPEPLSLPHTQVVDPVPADYADDTANPQIYLEDYVKLYVLGSDGFGYVYPSMDLQKLKEDCAKYLVDSTEGLSFYWGEGTPEDYLNRMFSHKDVFDLIDAKGLDKLSNGEKVTLTVELPDDGLDDLLTAKIEPATIEFIVKDLPPFESIDPFAYPSFHWSELVSVDGKIGYKINDYLWGYIQTPEGAVKEIDIDLHTEEERVYLPDETIHVSLPEEVIQRYTEQYGANIFSRTEADFRVGDVFNSLPSGDRATDIFKYMDETCIDNVDYAIKRLMDSCTETDTTVECIGMMFYYDNEGVLDGNEDTYKFYNRLVFIYKITNAHRPEGWYSFMALNGASGVGWQLNRAEKKLELCVCEIYGSHMFDDFRYYQNEHFRMAKDGYPASFTHNGVEYPGHVELADVFAAIKATMACVDEYDHLIVTDNLKSYIQTY